MTTSALSPTVVRAGVVDYREAWDEQRRIHAAVLAGEQPDTVLLLEHPSVYTAGKRTEPWDRPVDGTPVVDVDRGGKITWHGPGQLVGYPIVKLPGADSGQPVDVVAYVRRTEQLIFTSENLRMMVEEWERFWFVDQPDHMTPFRTHGGII